MLRLDRLSPEAAAQLLGSQHSVPDGRAFMCGSWGDAGNPLTLDRAVSSDEWPGPGWRHSRSPADGRRRTLSTWRVPEPGRRRQPWTRPVNGYSLPAGAFIRCPELGDVPSGLSRDPRARVGHEAVHGSQLRAPIHRQVAEFLAGRYLALIGDGMPARRVVSLMTGKTDDRVVTSLRGLSAWLAAHSREARPLLIDADTGGRGPVWRHRELDHPREEATV